MSLLINPAQAEPRMSWAYSLYNFEDSGVSLFQVRREHLRMISSREVLGQRSSVLCADSLHSQTSTADAAFGTWST